MGGDVIASEPPSPSGRQLVAIRPWAAAKVIWGAWQRWTGGATCWDPHGEEVHRVCEGGHKHQGLRIIGSWVAHPKGPIINGATFPYCLLPQWSQKQLVEPGSISDGSARRS